MHRPTWLRPSSEQLRELMPRFVLVSLSFLSTLVLHQPAALVEAHGGWEYGTHILTTSVDKDSTNHSYLPSTLHLILEFLTCLSFEVRS